MNPNVKPIEKPAEAETPLLFEEVEQPEVETTDKPHCGGCDEFDEG